MITYLRKGDKFNVSTINIFWKNNIIAKIVLGLTIC